MYGIIRLELSIFPSICLSVTVLVQSKLERSLKLYQIYLQVIGMAQSAPSAPPVRGQSVLPQMNVDLMYFRVFLQIDDDPRILLLLCHDAGPRQNVVHVAEEGAALHFFFPGVAVILCVVRQLRQRKRRKEIEGQEEKGGRRIGGGGRSRNENLLSRGKRE